MHEPLLRWIIGTLTGLCLVAAVLATKLDAHWALRTLLWLGSAAGLCFAVWREVLPETRDLSARAAQPGLMEGSSYGTGTGDNIGGGGDGGGG